VAGGDRSAGDERRLATAVSWWLLSFARRGPARYISHLDTMRVVQRTFARAGVELAFSQGMRPKPRLSLPLPLQTGAAALAELAVVEVAEETPAAALDQRLRALRAAAAEGFWFERLTLAEARVRPQPVAATYECRLPAPATAVAEALAQLVAASEVPVERRSPKGTRTLDLKNYVSELTSSPHDAGTKVFFTLRYGPGGSARVDEVVAALAAPLGIEPVVLDLVRTRVEWKGLRPRPSGAAEHVSSGGVPSVADTKEMTTSE
jgi:radical SAM-linked protein